MSTQLPKDVSKNPKPVQATPLDVDFKKMIGVSAGGKNLGTVGKKKGAPPKSNTAKGGQ